VDLGGDGIVGSDDVLIDRGDGWCAWDLVSRLCFCVCHGLMLGVVVAKVPLLVRNGEWGGEGREDTPPSRFARHLPAGRREGQGGRGGLRGG